MKYNIEIKSDTYPDRLDGRCEGVLGVINQSFCQKTKFLWQNSKTHLMGFSVTLQGKNHIKHYNLRLIEF